MPPADTFPAGATNFPELRDSSTLPARAWRLLGPEAVHPKGRIGAPELLSSEQKQTNRPFRDNMSSSISRLQAISAASNFKSSATPVNFRESFRG